VSEVEKQSETIEAVGEKLYGEEKQEVKEDSKEVKTETKEEAKPEAKAEDKAPTEFALKLPEGSLLSKEHLSKVEAFAKEHKLSKDVAQSLVEMKNAAVAEATAAQAESLKAQTETMKDVWYDETLADPEIGGDKARESVEFARRGLDAVASPELKKLLVDTGMGNHKEVIRTFNNLYKKFLAEDKVVQGGASVPSKKSLEETFYGQKQ
jgi:hypothetical protein